MSGTGGKAGVQGACNNSIPHNKAGQRAGRGAPSTCNSWKGREDGGGSVHSVV